jgi:ferredoxin
LERRGGGVTVIVDQSMCMRCGACVGSCPVNAMTLEETRITVNEACIDCWLCTRACPVGALDPVEA